MAHTLALTLDRPFTAVQLEKLWDGEQERRRTSKQPGYGRLHVDTRDSFRFTLVAEVPQGIAEPTMEELAACLRAAIERAYPDCHIRCGPAEDPAEPPRKAAAAAQDGRSTLAERAS